MIVEPVVQGAGGMRFHSPAYLRVLREACDAHDVLLVFDEIATGFGRTGALFAAEHAGGDAGRDVRGQGADRRLSDDGRDAVHRRGWPTASRAGEVPVLAHGPTFMGNPLAAAVACASIDLLLGQDWLAEVKRIEAGLRDGLAPAAELPGVRDVRVLGAIGVVQLDHEVDMEAATRGRGARGRVAAAVPRPRLHDAAVRHGRRRTWRGSRARCARRRGRDDMPVLVVTARARRSARRSRPPPSPPPRSRAGRSVAVLKPAQTGVGRTSRGTPTRSRGWRAPVTAAELARYPEPLAPGTAARRAGLAPVRPHEVAEAAAKLAAEHDLVLVEGAGGLLVRFDDGGRHAGGRGRAAGGAGAGGGLGGAGHAEHDGADGP